MYLTGEEFTNEFLAALRTNKLDAFRRKMRDLDLLVIDDVHFLGGKKATQEEFLHTFNAIEAMGRQVVMASDNHPKMIEEFGESLINRFVSGMVVRIDPPNYATRCEILRALALRTDADRSDEEVIGWIARRVTQNVRELEGAITRIAAHVKLTGRAADVATGAGSAGRPGSPARRAGEAGEHPAGRLQLLRPGAQGPDVRPPPADDQPRPQRGDVPGPQDREAQLPRDRHRGWASATTAR